MRDVATALAKMADPAAALVNKRAVLEILTHKGAKLTFNNENNDLNL